jgi:hypothetical protein
LGARGARWNPPDPGESGPRACLTNDKGDRPRPLETRTRGDSARTPAPATNSTILPGVVTGEDAVVGAVVTKDVPPPVVAGNPARVLRRVRPAERAQ